MPDTIEGRMSETHWPSHLYVADDGKFDHEFRSSWEPQLLKAEIDRDGFVGFLRNVDRKEWALCIPYRRGGQERPFYPDFIVFREVDGEPTVDILDPHSPSLADWWQKAVGLADYAARHGDQFNRIELVVVEGDTLVRLDVNQEQTRNRVRAVQSNDHLRDIFRDAKADS